MASIQKEILIDAAVDRVWDALRDVGAIHIRLVAGFVLECRLEGDVRHLRFANGVEASERIITVDEPRRRVVWSAQSPRLTHHNASAQAFADGSSRTRVVWIADLLPNEMEPAIAGMIDAGLAAMKRTLES